MGSKPKVRNEMSEQIPKEVLVEVPYDGTSLKGLKEFLSRYHLDLDIDKESDYFLDLFYNADLRSHCGWSEEFTFLRIFPEYYAKGWEDTYWKKLKDEATDFQVVRGSVQTARN